ncbi:hypothetical protein K440DRAFT_637614 [Wilcoxina mikolae CBS 423.85]|nr:hypothetical protein K440DRAFT_637614 [Wilcoxina mikolae CBS 423.85]
MREQAILRRRETIDLVQSEIDDGWDSRRQQRSKNRWDEEKEEEEKDEGLVEKGSGDAWICCGYLLLSGKGRGKGEEASPTMIGPWRGKPSNNESTKAAILHEETVGEGDACSLNLALPSSRGDCNTGTLLYSALLRTVWRDKPLPLFPAPFLTSQRQGLASFARTFTIKHTPGKRVLSGGSGGES